MKTLNVIQTNNRTNRKVICTEVHSLAEFANWLVSVHSEDDHYVTDKLGNLFDANASEIDNDGNVIYGDPIVDHADLQDSYWIGDHTYFVESDTDEPEPWEICTPKQFLALTRDAEPGSLYDFKAWLAAHPNAYTEESHYALYITEVVGDADERDPEGLWEDFVDWAGRCYNEIPEASDYFFPKGRDPLNEFYEEVQDKRTNWSVKRRHVNHDLILFDEIMVYNSATVDEAHMMFGILLRTIHRNRNLGTIYEAHESRGIYRIGDYHYCLEAVN